jgi:hypothetical protein
MSNVHDQELNHLFKVAMGCSECFTGNKLTRSAIDIAQPRWIGKNYWTAKPRVLIMLINPGAGATRRDDQDSKFRTLLHEYKQDKISIEPVFGHIKGDMANWGKLMAFYMHGFDLKFQEIAFANIAWCGEAANQHPPWMLNNSSIDTPNSCLRF